MARFPKVLLGLFVAAGIAVTGCNGSAPVDLAEPPLVEDPAEETTKEDSESDDTKAEGDADTPAVESQPNSPDPTTEAKPDMVAVSIYVMDDSCSNFEAESVEVPADAAMTEAVGEVLERHSFEAFKLSGYRVNVKDDKAIVDLRLAEDSERQFLSLSSCEQQGLFGGLEETLIQNQTWKVNQVEFTNRGKEIVL